MLQEPIRVLRHEDMERIHQAALTILDEVGMRIDSEAALAHLARAGCHIHPGQMRVTFPPAVVQGFVDRMRRAYDNPSRLPEKMAVRYSHIRFRREPHRIHPDFTASAGGFCTLLLDLDGTRRPATLDDVRRSITMVNALADIDSTGLPVSDQGMASPLRPVAMAAELAKYTTKLGGVETFRKEDIPFLIDIGTVVKGSEKALKEEPVLVGYAEARSPLCLDRNMVEVFMEYISRGFPQTLDTMPNGGATVPVTAAGNLAVAIAETLGGLVLAYAIDENAVVGVDIIPSNADPSCGAFRYASGDRMPLLVARVQMISEYYGCPSGVHGGKTDSCFVNIQAGIEKAMSTVFPVLAGAVGIGTVGHLENAVTFSPQQLVIDSEVIRSMRRSLQPIEVNDETLALDTIRAVGIGGNYMGEEHTLAHFRSELFLSPLFETVPWSSAHAPKVKGMDNRARELARSLWAKDPQPVLSADQIRAIDSIVARARREFLG